MWNTTETEQIIYSLSEFRNSNCPVTSVSPQQTNYQQSVGLLYLSHLLIQFALLQSLFLSSFAMFFFHLFILFPIEKHLLGKTTCSWQSFLTVLLGLDSSSAYLPHALMGKLERNNIFETVVKWTAFKESPNVIITKSDPSVKLLK